MHLPPFLLPICCSARILFSLLIFCIFSTSLVAQEKKEILRVGVYENKPKIFINQQKKADGFFIQLLLELTKDQNIELEYVGVTFNDGMRLLKEGKIDILPDVVSTDKRRKEYDINDITVLENWANLYIHKNDEPKYYTFQNIKNITIAAMQGDSNLDCLKKDLGADTTNINFILLPSYQEVLAAVEKQQAKLGLVNYYFGLLYDDAYDVQHLDMVINPSTVNFATTKGKHTALLKNFDNQLCLLKEDKNSIYYALIEEWLDPVDMFKFPRWLSILLSVLVVLAVFSILTLTILQVRLQQSKENLRLLNETLEKEIGNKSRAEESLRKRNEELANTNRTLDEFVYRVSHNLRSPLTSILGLISLLRLEIEQANTALENYLHSMEKSIHRLDETIREIIDYSRNSRMEIIMEEIPLKTMVQEVFSSMEFINPEVKFQLYTQIQEDIGLVSDKRRIQSVLHNLISNALKYYNPYVGEPWVKVVAQVDQKEAIIEVLDNGVGIPKDQQQNIFDMFYRGSAQGSGAGLGLYIVRQTLERLGGSIRLKSAQQEGSCFQLIIPNLLHKKTPDQKARRFAQ